MNWNGEEEPPSYDLEEGRVIEEIRRLNARRVLVQLPDGLRPRAFKLAERLREGTGAEILLSGDSCYGACDLALRQADSLDAHLLVHYGHSRMLPDGEIPVLYIEARSEVDLKPAVEKALPLIKGWEKVGLTTTIQHVHKLGEVEEILRDRGIEPHIGRGGSSLLKAGTVIGCDYGSALSILRIVDGYLFIGGGRFHPIGLALATGKRVVAADPYIISAFPIEESELNRLIMRRLAAMEAARKARSFYIVVSLKPGQFHLKDALNLKVALEERGRKAAILCLDEVRVDVLNNFTDADAFIDTACPRIALDGLEGLSRPFITLKEAEAMIGLRSMEEVWRYQGYVEKIEYQRPLEPRYKGVC